MQGSNDQHPDHDISLGEQYYKDIYEALRSSPQWEETLFIITYDEHGGYYDHVPTPLNVPPPGDDEASYPDVGVKFDRLGVRIPTLLISPWIPKGLVVSAPPNEQKPANNSEYSLTSIIATTRKLLNMQSPPLTKRDAWSATFEQVLSLTEPRTDCPLHLPPASPPSSFYSAKTESLMPINDLQRQIMTVHAHLAGSDFPDHLQHQGKVAEWTKQKFQHHVKITNQWKNSKTNSGFDLRVRSTGGFAYSSFNLNKGKNMDFIIISVRTANNSLCVDYGTATPVPGTRVGVANCYPSFDADNNRDVAQQWVWEKDSTIRPFSNENLCLTTAILEYDENVYLINCAVNTVEQNWGYYGSAPGNYDSGEIVFGASNLGVITVV